MWPFKRRSKPRAESISDAPISFSQVDLTERFDDDRALRPDEWIATTPLNAGIPEPESMGLPKVGAADDEVYAIAARPSKAREVFQLARDGVYCPVCHIANTDRKRLHSPCPKCGRNLLLFGWD